MGGGVACVAPGSEGWEGWEVATAAKDGNGGERVGAGAWDAAL